MSCTAAFRSPFLHGQTLLALAGANRQKGGTAIRSSLTEKTMHVLHFFKTYWPDTFGGVERTIHALAKGAAPMA